MTASERGAVITPFTLAMNYLPLAQLLLGALIINTFARGTRDMLLGAAVWLFLLPPLVARLTFLLFGNPQGRGLTQDSRAYKVWWFTHQWQVVFNRLPWIEEMLRLVPGLYSLWIRLWGGRVSPMVYWAPGSQIVDRPLVIVEPGAVIGMGAGLTGHLGTLGPDGTYRVDVAAPRVGRGAIMGTRSGLGPSAELVAHQVLPAGRLIPPFVRWDGSAKRPVAEEVLETVDA